MINRGGALCDKCGGKLYKDIANDVFYCKDCGKQYDIDEHIGKKDRELIEKVGNKLKHKSTLEQLVYWFDIDGISRAALQELARHRTARMVVKSTRYTLKELKNEKPFTSTLERGEALTTFFYISFDENSIKRAKKYIVLTGNYNVDARAIFSLEMLRQVLTLNTSNDIAKYALPEAFKTKLQWQIDGRNLQNFLELRSAKDALWEMQELAQKIYKALPNQHKYLFREYMGKKEV